MNMVRKYTVLLSAAAVLLLPATAQANGLQALAVFVGFLLVGAAVAFSLVLALLIVSAIIGRKNAPRRPWKRVYAWTAVVVGSLCELYLLPLAIMALVVFGEGVAGGDQLLLSAVILATLLGGVSIIFAVRVLRRNPREKT